MGYIETLTQGQKKNVSKVVDSLITNGITNPFSISAILSVVSKESGLTPQSEKGYGNTSVSRIRQIFGSRVSKLSDAEIENLKKDDVAFFDQVYGSQWKSLGLGNTQKGDGYKYRGRGFNQVTGRAAYEKYQKATGYPLVSDPDLLNEPDVAAAVLAAYFKNTFASSSNKLSKYNSTGINDFKTLTDAVLAFYHANAGWGKDITNDATGGKKKAMDRGPQFYEYLKTIGKNIPFLSIGLSLLIGGAIGAVLYFIYTKTIKR